MRPWDGRHNSGQSGTAATPALLSVRDLSVQFESRRGIGEAVSDVTFSVGRGETLGLVGESGSGKSITALAIMGILPELAKVVSGSIEYKGHELLSLTAAQMRNIRGQQVSMVLQDPSGALNPSFTVGNQIEEGLRLNKRIPKPELKPRAISLLSQMRIPHPAERLDSYPHQFSGGMQQRVVGAIGIGGDPDLLIADEPTTALDVTVQAAYLELLQELQGQTGMSILFITHDFGIVGDICDRVIVMYAGTVTEIAPTETALTSPVHPYTQALTKSVPDIRRPSQRLGAIGGSPPSIYTQPEGCRFHPRCWLYQQLGEPELCRTDVPKIREAPGSQSAASCHYIEDAAQASNGRQTAEWENPSEKPGV